MNPRSARALTIAVAVILLECSGAFAQASLQVPVQFDFLNPGARSLALGSAFAGLADDATAAFTNPAGLTLLSRPEVSIEGRARRLESSFLRAGRLSGRVTNQGVDVASGPVYGTFDDTHVGPSFLSLTYPRGRFAIAAYRHELLNVDQAFRTSSIFQADAFGDVVQGARDASRQIAIVTYGISAAHRAGSHVSFGGGLIVQKMSFSSDFRTFDPPSPYAAPDFAKLSSRTIQSSDDTGVGGTFGVLVTLSPRLQLGGVYRKAPSFDFTTQPVGGTSTTGTFHVPDTLAVGAAVRVAIPLLVTVEYTRVHYSALKVDFIDSQVGRSTGRDNFTIDDGNEVHAGLEYVFTNVARTPAVRVGAWYDPRHTVRYTPSAQRTLNDELFSAYLPRGRNLVHATAGAGVAISSRLEMNAAFDYSSRTRTGSASVVVRF